MIQRVKLGLGVALAAAVLLTAPAVGQANAEPSLQATANSLWRTGFDPTPEGVQMPGPITRVPLRKADAQGAIYVPNGYHTSADELPVLGSLPDHFSLDITLEGKPQNGHGAPILAGMRGRAYRTYQYIPFDWTDPKTGVVHRKSVGGIIVEVRQASPEDPTKPGEWVSQFLHFSAANPSLTYLPPVPTADGGYFPQGLLQSNQALWDLGVEVQADTVIGWMGRSGLNKDCVEVFNLATGEVQECSAAQSWDVTHLHWQLYRGRDANNVKRNIVDIPGIWGQVWPGEWPGVAKPSFNPYTPVPGLLRAGPKTALITNQFGRPLYADEH